MQETKLIFQKEERLTGEIRIKELFEKGKFFLSYPFRLGYLPVQKTPIPVQVLMAVPKKRFKHAVDRNRLKRLMREVYRKNKAELYSMVETKDYSLNLSINYIASEKLDYITIEKKLKDAIAKLIKQLP
jgi:ribonuclease P protein component